MTQAYERELTVARRLAREAGKMALDYRGGDFEVELKSGNEPVTVVDRTSSEMIVRGLTEAFPGDVIISEENADDLRRLDADRVWYIDPIDGTKDYIRGLEGFSVMIGLTVNHRPVAGVVHQPMRDRDFYAGGDGAYCQAPGEEPRRLAVSSVNDLTRIRLVASKSHRSSKLDEVKSALGIDNELNIGSVGLKLCIIALGERDLYVNPWPYCKSWDTCAPEAILHAAGGKMTDLHGDPLRYDERDTQRTRGLIASNGAVHDAVVERMRPLFPRT